MFPKKHKYNARRSFIDGHHFASQLEASVYSVLKYREIAGEVKDIKCQHTVDLGHGIKWKCDFKFYDIKEKEEKLCEAKGIENPDYIIKLKLYRYYGDKNLEIWKGSAKKPRLVEIIFPKKLTPPS